MVTRSPRDSRMAASEAAAMPLPREETTPPVTNTYLVIVNLHARGYRTGAGNLDYSRDGTACWRTGGNLLFCFVRCCGLVAGRILAPPAAAKAEPAYALPTCDSR